MAPALRWGDCQRLANRTRLHSSGGQNDPALDGSGRVDRQELARWVQWASGQHLIELMRHSDTVFDSLLMLAGRHRFLATKKLVHTRDKLSDLIQHIDQLLEDSSSTS
jgi:hypothetical protein